MRVNRILQTTRNATEMQIFKAMLAFLLFCAYPCHAAENTEVSLGRNADGSDLGMGLYRPTTDPNGAAVVFIVSGGMHSGLDVQINYEPRFQPLLDDGFTVFAVRHTSVRNIPDPQDLIPTIFNQISIAYRHVVQHAAEYSVDPQKIGVLGISSGGVLAYFLALSENFPDGSQINVRPKAAAVYAGPAQLRENYPSLAAINLVSEGDPPVLLIHGTADETVPFSDSKSMYSALQSHGVPSELIAIEGEGHDAIRDATNGEKVFNEATRRWFRKHLLN